MSVRHETRESVSTLHRIGLKPEDISRRGVVAVGYVPGELLPPYPNPGQASKARRILQRLTEPTAVTRLSSPEDIAAHDWRSSFPDEKVVEVVGAYTSYCVTEAVQGITTSGLVALVDSSLTFENRPYHSSHVLSTALKTRVLSHRGIQHLPLGRDRHVFYSASAKI